MEIKNQEDSKSVTVVEVKLDPESPPDDPRAVDGRSLKPPKLSPLNDREELFVPFYAEGETKGNATASARMAGYSESFCKSKAHKLAKRPHIIAAVNAYIITNHRAAADPVVAAMETRLIKISKFDIGSVFMMDSEAPGGIRLRDLTEIDTSCLKKIKVKVTPLGYSLEVEGYHAMEAIKMYLQSKGLYGEKHTGRGKTLHFNLIFGGAPPPDQPAQPPTVVNPNG